MSEIKVSIETIINPTEDIDKIKKAIENFFLNINYEEISTNKKKILIGRTEGLRSLKKLQTSLRLERIRDAARSVLFKGLKENSITFYLNKQVAFVSHISFSKQESESPLGPIKIKIQSDNSRELIDWLTPKTIKR